MPPLLASMNIGDVELNEGNVHAEKGVSDRHARVRQAAWIQ